MHVSPTLGTFRCSLSALPAHHFDTAARHVSPTFETLCCSPKLLASSQTLLPTLATLRSSFSGTLAARRSRLCKSLHCRSGGPDPPKILQTLMVFSCFLGVKSPPNMGKNGACRSKMQPSDTFWSIFLLLFCAPTSKTLNLQCFFATGAGKNCFLQHAENCEIPVFLPCKRAEHMANTEVLASGRLQDDNHAGQRKNHNPWGRCAKLRGFPDQGAIEFRIEKALQRSPQFGAIGWWLSHLLLVGNILLILMVNINDG